MIGWKSVITGAIIPALGFLLGTPTGWGLLAVSAAVAGIVYVWKNWNDIMAKTEGLAKGVWHWLFGGGGKPPGMMPTPQSFTGGGTGGLLHKVSLGGGIGGEAGEYPKAILWRLDRIIEILRFSQRIMGAGFAGIPGWTYKGGAGAEGGGIGGTGGGTTPISLGGTGAGGTGSVTGGVPNAAVVPKMGGIGGGSKNPAYGSLGAGQKEVADYIRQAAIARGIDPNVALKISWAESKYGSSYSGDYGYGQRGATSFGPFQLHEGGRGSVGTEAERAGIAIRNKATWRQQVDFALNWAARHGWGAWTTARNMGLTHAGLSGAHPVAVGSAFQKSAGDMRAKPYIDDEHIDDAIKKVERLNALIKSMDRKHPGAHLDVSDAYRHYMDERFQSSHIPGS